MSPENVHAIQRDPLSRRLCATLQQSECHCIHSTPYRRSTGTWSKRMSCGNIPNVFQIEKSSKQVMSRILFVSYVSPNLWIYLYRKTRKGELFILSSSTNPSSGAPEPSATVPAAPRTSAVVSTILSDSDLRETTGRNPDRWTKR